MKHHVKGFSLIELMIVIAVIAILLALSYPSYASFVRKSNRSEAVVTLLDWANRQDIWRAEHPDYSADITPPNSELYSYSIASTAISYTLTATALDQQASDKEDGIACTALTLNQEGVMGPSGHETCWHH